ncbi:hypothetical protein T265_06178 [Opisthorchis viverrini]|uniref:Peptidase M16 N-terminal domain-containing protein n=1 Tax=Opisthorchis viverrini TaxID=6198 RepID=A0A075AEB4_OPIVI|nr:hypothetical protein T265_06178 [Opisthorchis viverrini]KER26604.1 hypothetical protein T265_06178 [Opisthorchis viverrini]
MEVPVTRPKTRFLTASLRLRRHQFTRVMVLRQRLSNTSQFRCSNRPSLTAIQQDSPYCSLIHTDVFSDCTSTSMTLHFVVAKCIRKDGMTLVSSSKNTCAFSSSSNMRTIPPSTIEVQSEILTFQCGKPLCSDDLHSAIFQEGDEVLVQRIWNENGIPAEWGFSTVIPVFKKGERTLCESHRSISLASVASKVICGIVLRKLIDDLERHSLIFDLLVKGASSKILSPTRGRDGPSAVRTRLLPLDFPCLGLGNLTISQPSCLRVAWQLGTERVLQLNDFCLFFTRALYVNSCTWMRVYSRLLPQFTTSTLLQGCVGLNLNIMFADEPIDVVDEFLYVSSSIRSDELAGYKTKAAFVNFRYLWRRYDVGLCQEWSLHCGIVNHTFYGSDTWSLCAEDIRKLSRTICVSEELVGSDGNFGLVMLSWSSGTVVNINRGLNWATLIQEPRLFSREITGFMFLTSCRTGVFRISGQQIRRLCTNGGARQDITKLSLITPIRTEPQFHVDNFEDNKTNITTLPSRLRIASQNRFGAHCAIGVIVDAGPRYETNRTNGLSHFLEKLGFHVCPVIPSYICYFSPPNLSRTEMPFKPLWKSVMPFLIAKYRDRLSREAEVGFEPRTFRSVNLRSTERAISPPDHAILCIFQEIQFTSSLHPSRCCLRWARWPKWLGREFIDWKVRGSNPTSASRLPLSRLGQPGSFPVLVQPSGCRAVGHREAATAERLFVACDC